MQAGDLGRIGVTLIAGLAAWEVGQVVATFLIIGFFGDHFQLAFAPGGGFDQLDTLAVLLARLAIATLVALPILLLLGRVMWRERSR